ncbi:MAG: hypothetical protein JST86_11555 [Bacteroidetes bacterium]|nr:hypothetical protein [Bacteroidota bacterium]
MMSVFFSCKEVQRHETKSNNAVAHDTIAPLKHPRYNNLAEVVKQQDELRYWASKESYYPTVHFNIKDTVWMEFDGQCDYIFLYKLKGKSIVVYWWDIMQDCTHDIGIKKAARVKDKPTKGKPFMLLKLANDTTLQATYLYRSWINAVNKSYNGSEHFPELFLSCGEYIQHQK